MSYETAWKEMMKIISNVKESKMDDDLDAIVMCVEHLQSKLNEDKN